MNRLRLKWVLGILFLGSIFSPTLAQAEFYKDVIRGFELFDYRFSGEKNFLGNGWDISAGAAYNNRTFHLGLADVTFNGTVIGTGGYTLRGIPEAHFSLTTAGQPLSYAYDINTGFQDLFATGNILINIDTSINVLGFYDQVLQVSNRGEYQADGFGLETTETLDYDIGPINISGNVYADALTMLTQPFFDATGTENPFAKFSAKASKSIDSKKTATELRARVEAGEILSDQEIAKLVNNTIIAAALGAEEPGTDLFDGLLMPKNMLEPDPNIAVAEAIGMEAPEPTMLLLMGLGTILIKAKRRKLGRRG